MVAAVASCSKMERVPDKTMHEIVLSAFGGTMTKSNALSTDVQFGVYAFYSACDGGTDWNDPNAWGALTSSSTYIDNGAFAHRNGFWGGDPTPYYWPVDGSLMFAGYAPMMTVDSDENPTGPVRSVELVANQLDMNPYLHINFTQNTNPAQMVDFLWFDVKDVAGGKTISKTDQSISIEFKHALAQVSFEFLDAANHFQLKSIKLKDCINTSEFYSGATPGWLPAIDAVADYVFLNVAEDAEKPQFNGWETPDDEMLYIIPQYLDGIFPSVNGTLDNGLDVVLEFTLTDGFGSEVVQIPLKNYTERWEMGKHYHYTVSVMADPIEFTTPDFTITTQVVSM